MRNKNKAFQSRGPKLFSLGFVAVLAISGLSSCGNGAPETNEDSSSEAAAEEKTVAFSFPFRAVDIYKPLIDAAKEEAEKLNVKLLESSSGISAAEQLSEVNTWIAQDVDAIVLFSLEPDSMAPTIEKAHEAGIEVIGYGEHLPDEDGSIVFNNEQGADLVGKITAEYINEQLGGEAKVGVLSMLTGKQNRIRTENASTNVKALSPGAKFVAEAQANDAGTALEVMRPMLAANPGINVIISNTDDSINGVAAALKAVNRQPDSIWFGSYDASTPILKKMLAGDLVGVTASIPTAETGRAVVSNAVHAIAGEGSTTYAPDYVAITPDDTQLIEQILTERGAM